MYDFKACSNTWYLYYVSVRACDNNASPFEGVWSWVVERESVWQGGPSTTVLRADLGQNPEYGQALQLRTHTHTHLQVQQV